MEDACRTCGAFFDGEGVLIPIFSEIGVIISQTNMEFQIKDELDLLKVIIEKDDNLPQQICIHCANTLKTIHIFRGICKIAQEVLKEYFNTSILKHSTINEIHLEEKCNFSQIEDQELAIEHDDEEDESFIEDQDLEFNTRRDEENTSPIAEIEKPIYSKIEIQLCDPSLDTEEDTNIIKGNSYESNNFDNKINTQKEPVSTIRKCEKCHQCGYLDIAKYDVHKIKCVSRPFDNKFFCLYCDKEFETMNDTENHLHKSHPIIDRPYKCPVCDEYFKTKLKREEHVKTHNIKRPYKCDICNKGLGGYAHLRRHKTLVHSRNYECKECHKKFKSYLKLDYHSRLHYPEKRYKCQYCGKLFMHLTPLKEHERTHTGEKPYKCKLCDKAFAVNSSLKFHMQLHLGIKAYKCDVCGKGYATRNALAHHTPFHSDDRPYQCEYCGRSFKTAHNLKTHHRSHTDERPFKCDLCEKTYRQNLQLKHHKASAHGIGVRRKKQTYKHSKDKIKRRMLTIKNRILDEIEPIQCPICPKSFRLHNGFENHMKTHNEEKKFICNECGSMCKTSTSLKFHMKRIHLKEKSYKCPYCDKTFVETGERNAHVKWHKNEKPFKCSYCEKTFKFRTVQKSHERVHTGEKPFKCLICQRSFSSHAHLTRHTLIHTTEEKEILTQRILADNNFNNE